jgi:hypothetical protein
MSIVALKSSMTEMDFFRVDRKAAVGRGRKSGTERDEMCSDQVERGEVGLRRGRQAVVSIL